MNTVCPSSVVSIPLRPDRLERFARALLGGALMMALTAAPGVRADVITLAPAFLTNSVVQGANASSQTFTVRNTSSTNAMAYALASSSAWLTYSPTNGVSTGEVDTITLNYATTGLVAATYSATVTVSSASASNSPQSVAVTLTVTNVIPTLPVVNTTAASGIAANSATLNGSLVSTGQAPTYVRFYWGLADGGTTATAWAASTVTMGPRPVGAFSTNVTGLASNTVYYYRAYASNVVGGAWASARSAFTTLGAPVVRYVSAANLTPLAPYTNWLTAATNIQTAINVATNGDMLLVSNGVYAVTNAILVTKALTIRSVNGARATFVDGQNLVACFALSNAATLLDGFTLTRGRAANGGGLQCAGTVQNCVIVSNTATARGGGVYIANGSTNVLYNCVIRDNRAVTDGGGVACMMPATIRNCLIASNTATNKGGGVWAGGSGVIIQSCTIAGNTAVTNAGGGVCFVSTGTNINSIVYSNQAPSSVNCSTGMASFSYTCAAPVPSGIGNTAANPLFAAPGDYRLAAASPCVDAGTNQAWMTGAVDLTGTSRIQNLVVDLGAYEGALPPPAAPVRIVATAYGPGTISPSGTVVCGSAPVVTNFILTAAPGCHISQILTNGVDVAGLTKTETNFNLQWSGIVTDGTVDAYFASDVLALTACDISEDGWPRLRWSSLTGRTYGVDRCSDTNLDTGTFTAIAAELAATPPENVFTDTAAGVLGERTYRVNIGGAIYSVNTASFLYFQPAASGPGLVDRPGAWYTNGAAVTVTATPSNGCVFAGWTGDVPAAFTNANPVTLTMDVPRQITAIFVPLSAGGLTVLAPNGDEVGPRAWLVGVTNIIRWASTGTVSSAVAIDFSDDGGASWQTVTASTPNIGSYSWVAPGNSAAWERSQCLIRVRDANDPTICDQSDAFFELVYRFRLLSPNGGEKWYIGTTNAVVWEAPLNIGSAAWLYYNLSGSTTDWARINNLNIPNTPGSANNAYLWAISTSNSDLLSEHARVSIAIVGSWARMDMSDGEYVLAGIGFQAPTATTAYRRGNIATIRWISSGAGSQGVNIDFAADGVTWTNIAAAVPNIAGTNSYDWLVTADNPTPLARLRITSVEDPLVWNVSDPFTVAAIDMQAPRAGDVWAQGSTNLITWTSGGAGPAVNIYYSSDDGLTWMSVVAGCTNVDFPIVNTYAWVVPQISGNYGRIKVESTLSPDLFAVSPPFPIVTRPAVKIVSPVAGDFWRFAETHVIQWTKAGNMPDAFDVAYSTNEFATQILIVGTPVLTNGVYCLPWAPGDPGKLGAIRVRVTNSANPDYSDTSTPFYLVPKLAMLSPNGGETFYALKPTPVLWSTMGDATAFDLYYTTDPARSPASWVKVNMTGPIGGQGNGQVSQYLWTVANIKSPVMWLRIQDAGYTNMYPADVPGPFADSVGSFAVNYYTIKWHVYDASTSNELDQLSVRDSSGWSPEGLLSAPYMAHEYPYGVFDTVWSRDAFCDVAVTNWSSEPSRTIDVPMSPILFTIQAAAGPNGTIAPSGTVTVASGGSAAFDVVANPGFHVADVVVDGLSVGATNRWTFADVATNHSIRGLFELTKVLPVLDTLTATNVTSSSAILRGNLRSLGIPTNSTVYVYYGTTDGGVNAGAWQRNLLVGTRPLGIFTYGVGALASNSVYYFRCAASNAAGIGWAPTSAQFTTPPPPVLAVSTNTMSMTIATGMAAVTNTLEVWNAGPGLMSYNISHAAPWLNPVPYVGSNTGKHDRIAVICSATNLTPGVYTSQLTVYGSYAVNSPQTIMVTLTVLGGTPSLAVDPTNLTAIVASSTDTVSSTFRVWNGGPGALTYTVSNDVPWCTVAPASGMATGQQDTIVATFSAAGLATGTYSGALWVCSPDVTNSPRAVGVTLNVFRPPVVVTQPATNVSPNSAGFCGNLVSVGWPTSCQVRVYYGFTNGGDAAAAWSRYVLVGNRAPGPFAWTIGGLASNAAYYYRCWASNAAGAVWASGTVCFTTPPPTVIALNTTAFARVVSAGQNPTPDAFEIRNSGPGAMNYYFSWNAPWFSVMPSGGVSTGEVDRIAVTYAAPGFVPGVYTGQITVFCSTAANSPQTIPVSLTVLHSAPSLQVDPTNLTRMATTAVGSTNMTFRVWNGGGGTVAYTVSNDAPWFTVSPPTGVSSGEQDIVTVTCAPATLGIGVYSGTIWIASPDVTNSPRAVQVGLTVNPPPAIMLSTSVIVRTAAQGTSLPSDSFRLWNGGAGVMTFSVTTDVPWAWANPAVGSSTGDIRNLYINYYASAVTNLAEGVYTGTVTIASPQAVNSPQTVALVLQLTPRLRLAVDPLLVTNRFNVGNPAPSRSFRLWNAGTGSFGYTLLADAPWLTLWPSNGVCFSPGTNYVTVQFATAGLSAGTYTSKVTVAAAGAADAPQVVTVVVDAIGVQPVLAVTPTRLEATAIQGQAAASLPLSVWNAARTGVMTYRFTPDVPWLTATPASGTSTGAQDAVNVAFDPAGLVSGVYSGNLVVASAEATNAPVSLPVIFHVAPPPAIWSSTDRLTWTLRQGDSATNTFSLRNSGGGTLAYTLSADVPWATPLPDSGSSTGEYDTIRVAVNTSKLGPGLNTGMLTVTAPGATGAVRTITLACIVWPQPVLAASPLRTSVSAVQGSNAPSATVEVWNAAPPLGLPYQLTANVPWLGITPPCGVSTGEHDTVRFVFATVGMGPGTYTGLVTVAAAGATNVSLDLAVVLTVTPQPAVISRLPERLDQHVIEGSVVPVARAVEIWNASVMTGAMAYAVSADVPWLAVDPSVGCSSGQHNLHQMTFTNLDGLTVGVYSGQVTITCAGAANSPQTVGVTLTVDPAPPCLAASPGWLVASNDQGQAAAAQPLSVWNANGTNALVCRAWATVPWLVVDPPIALAANGQPAVFTNRFLTAALLPGEYDGAVLVSAPMATNSPLTVGVHLTVRQQPSVIGCDPAGITQVLPAGGTGAVQRFSIWNAGTGTMTYAISADVPWLTVSPGAGTVTNAVRRTHSVAIQAVGLDEGTYTGCVTIAADGAANGPVAVPVRLTVRPVLAVAPMFVPFVTGPGTNPAPRVIQVWNAGTANPISYTAVSHAPWLTAVTTNGTAAGAASGEVSQLTLAVDVTGLAPGVYNAAVDLVPDAWPETWQRLVVRLTIAAPGGQFAEKIVFDSSRAGDSDIWMVNPDGSGLAPLVVRPGNQCEPRLSPDGLKLAYRDATTNSLVVLDLATRVERTYKALYGYDWLPDSSGLVGPDSTEPAADIWKVLLDGTTAPLFTESDRQSLMGVDRYSGRVYYTTDPGTGSNSEIRVLDPVTSSRSIVIARDGAWRSQGNVSRDGRSLCYVKAAYGQVPVVTLASVDGLTESRLCAGGVLPQYMPDFSPDGNQVVFQGMGMLWLADTVAGTNAPTLLVSGPVCNWPAWGTLFLHDPDVPLLAVTPPALTNVVKIGTEPDLRWLDVSNAGNGTLTFAVSNSIPWLRVTPAIGASTGDVVHLRCDFQAAGLAPGAYTGTVAVIGNASDAPLAVPVVLTIQPPDPVLICDPQALSNVVLQGCVANDRYLRIRNAGGGAMAYGLASDASWITFVPASGISTGETDIVVVRCDATGMDAGVTSATIVVTAEGALGSPLSVPVTLTVVAPRPQPPVLAVAPSLLTATLPEGVTFAQTFDVWNAGATVLVYSVSCAADWVDVAPTNGSSQGERDRIEVGYRTAGLAEGLHQASIVVASSVGTQTVQAAVTVLPAPRFRLNVYTNPPVGGSVGLSPAQPTNGYPRGTVVTLTAYDTAGYLFTHWAGIVSATNRAIVVTLDADKFVQAYFQQLTTFQGYVTNTVTGVRIGGALVQFGAHAMTTGPDGYYGFMGVEATPALLQVGRAGYRTRQETYWPPCYTSVWRNLGLVPAFVTNVRAAQRPGTKLIEINYDLDAPTNDVPPVTLEASTVGGLSWNLRLSSVSGDLGSNVVPGVGRRIVWDAGADWPGTVATQMAMRVSAGGSRGVTPVFSLNTREQGEWCVRVWNDRNRNGRYDAGESLAGTEVYYDGRTAANRIGVTDSNGQLRVFTPLQQGRSLFARKAVATARTPKPMHGAVDNTANVVWQDSDVGGTDSNAWDGVWRTYVVSSSDVAQSELGSPVYLKLAHTLIEWNLLVACEVASADFTTRLKAGLAQASAYLYDVTDGQVKLGSVAVSTGVTRASSLWNSADVVILAQAEAPPSASLNGALLSGIGRIQMGTTWKGLPPDEAAWHRTFIKQFCMYAFGLCNENADGRGNTAAWQVYRAANRDKVPSNYGVMDDPVNASELSAWHNYLPYYPGSTDATRVTQQIYNHSLRSGAAFYPGWQWLELMLQRYYSNTFAEIVVPVRGYYAGGDQSTSESRPGPWFIPAPYEICHLAGSDVGVSAAGGGANGALVAMSGAVAMPGISTILVQRDGRAVPCATILRWPAGGTPAVMLGRTDASGRLSVYDLAAGDRLQVAARGQVLDHVLSPPDLAGPLVLSLGTPGLKSTAGGIATMEAVVESAGPVAGTVVAYALVPDPRALQVTVSVDHLLTAAPDVTATLEDGTTFAAAMSLVADGVYQGAVPLGALSAGTVAIACTPVDGVAYRTVDSFAIDAVAAADGATVHSPAGRAAVVFEPDLLSADAEALVVENELPPILPAGFLHTNAVAGQVCVALPDGVTASGTSVTLNVTYDAAALAGLDENSIRLYAWDPALKVWTEVSSTLASDLHTVSAAITSGGTFALFADPSADVTPPAAINDLVATGGDQPWGVRLTWTAPGDDGMDGCASTYVLKFSTDPITNWATASVYPMSMKPAPAGSTETFVLTMPDLNRLYHFALVAQDEAGNAGPMSNVSAARSAYTDNDNDGIPDQLEASASSDGQVADLDADPDHDGLTTREEYALGTDPWSWDTDGDGMSDGWEISHGLSPTSSADGLADDDHDGVCNRAEYLYGTDPHSADTDGDGIPDGWELLHGLNAISASGDQGALADPDADGFSNIAEYTADSNPFDATSNLRIEDVREGLSGREIRFTSSAARIYDLFMNTDLTVNGWTPVLANQSGAGTETVLTDTNTAATVWFYKIQVRLPPAP